MEKVMDMKVMLGCIPANQLLGTESLSTAQLESYWTGQ